MREPHYYWPVIVTLAIWRITHLLTSEEGPWHLVARLRRAAGQGFSGELLDCFYCLSLWISAPFAFSLGETWTERLVLWPALSGGAILLERLTARREAIGAPQIEYSEDPEQEHVLWKRTNEIHR
jgi:hypothetical protein